MQNDFMKAVKQEDGLGCGIACVAYVLGISYPEAKPLFKGLADVAKPEFYPWVIVRALRRGGLEYRHHYFEGRARWKAGTIVLVRKSEKHPYGHYLVKGERGWMDPWINLKPGECGLKKAKAGFRDRLPGRPWYWIEPTAKAI